MSKNEKCLKSSHSANFGGGNFLSPRNEGLENGTAKPCHSEARSAVRIALPQPLADMNFSEGSIQTLTTMRSLRVPSRGMSEAKGEQESTETLSFRCDCERCRFMRGRIHFVMDLSP